MLDFLAWLAGGGVLLTAALASFLLGAACKLFRKDQAALPRGEEEFCVIIPALTPNPQRLKALLANLTEQVPPSAMVIVVLQEAEVGLEMNLRYGWSGTAELRILYLEGVPGKASAIRGGLSHVETTWSVLLDSDVNLTDVPLAELCQLSRDVAACYGVIVSESSGNWSLPEAVVWWDKAVSHGIYRAGRFQTGLWPNLPGQCYAIRTDCLREIYSDVLGHLDDLEVTLALAAGGHKVRFIPRLVGQEMGRSGWGSLCLQRTRWTIGLFQSWQAVWRSGGNSAAIVCLLLHAWLYHGAPVIALAGCSLFLLVGQPLLAVASVGLYLVIWSACAVCGAGHLRRVASVSSFPMPPFWTIPLAALAILTAQSLGLLLAPGFTLLEAMAPRRSKVLLHKR